MAAPEPADSPNAMRKVVDRVMGKEFSKTKLMLDMCYPRTSALTGTFLNGVLQATFARRRLEDLLIPFLCTTTDILNLEPKVHREGPMWRLVRASMSLVGLVPPLCQQETDADGNISQSLLVDGGYTNNWPVEALHEMGAGTVILVICSPNFDPIFSDYGDSVQGGVLTAKNWLSSFICRKRNTDKDPPTQSQIQERLMFLMDAMKGGKTRDTAALTLHMPIENYGLLDFHKFEEIAKLGYDYSQPRLVEFLQGDSSGARWIRKVIETDGLDNAKSVHRMEYGGRHIYGKFRKELQRLRFRGKSGKDSPAKKRA